MAFRDLKLGTKQGLGFGFILVALAGVSVFAITQMAALRDEIDDIDAIWLQRAVVTSRLNINASALRTNQLQHAFARTDAQKLAYVDTMLTLIDAIDADGDVYQRLKEESVARGLFSDEEARLTDELETLWERYLEYSLAYLTLFDERRNQEALDLLNGVAGDVFSAFSTNLDLLVRRNQANAAAAAARAETTFRTTRNRIILLLVLTIAGSVLLAVQLVARITVPVRQLVNAARRVAGGDFAVRLEIPSKDEIGKLARSFTRMTASLEAQQEALRTTNAELAQQKTEIEQKNTDLEQALDRLRATQQQLVMQEKLASLGQLTAGIAHEIKNPLNFVNNFAALSVELADELGATLDAHRTEPVAAVQDEVDALLSDLRFNARKIHEHGHRADGIVRSMLQHSRSAPGERQPTPLNDLLEEYVNLAYHGMRASRPTFQATLERAYDAAVGPVAVVPQDLGRVLLNLLNNAFYAVHARAEAEGPAFAPRVAVSTHRRSGTVEVRVQDNGGGIPEAHHAHIFEPFFTTKPTGEGNTGLGLSLSYEIVTQGHGGTLAMESTDGEGTTFLVALPG